MKHFSKKQKLSLTVGITTCYGDISILNTVKSVKNSEDAAFDFIIIADRTPISDEIKKELKEYNVLLVENTKEGSQIKKQKQIIALSKTDLILFTQDDVLLDRTALSKSINSFKNNPDLTMVSIVNKPMPAKTNFEKALNIGTNIANKTSKSWKGGNNYLSVIGRYMMFRKTHLEQFRLNENVATSDAYYYFENKRLGGKYKYLPNTYVAFRNPQSMKEHLRKSSRFQYSNKEMSKYFDDVNKEYSVPLVHLARAVLAELIKDPISAFIYFTIFSYTRILRLQEKKVLNPIWEVDLSTKKI